MGTVGEEGLGSPRRSVPNRGQGAKGQVLAYFKPQLYSPRGTRVGDDHLGSSGLSLYRGLNGFPSQQYASGGGPSADHPNRANSASVGVDALRF